MWNHSLVRTQNFPKSYYFLPLYTHISVLIRGIKTLVFRNILRTYLMNDSYGEILFNVDNMWLYLGP